MRNTENILNTQKEVEIVNYKIILHSNGTMLGLNFPKLHFWVLQIVSFFKFGKKIRYLTSQHN